MLIKEKFCATVLVNDGCEPVVRFFFYSARSMESSLIIGFIGVINLTSNYQNWARRVRRLLSKA